MNQDEFGPNTAFERLPAELVICIARHIIESSQHPETVVRNLDTFASVSERNEYLIRHSQDLQRRSFEQQLRATELYWQDIGWGLI